MDQALEQGREVFALPGRVGDKLSEGCLHLIRNGANVLMESGDVISYLYPNRMKSGDDNEKYATNNQEKGTIIAETERRTSTLDAKVSSSNRNAVYSVLDCVGKTMEEIMNLTKLPLEEVRAQLLDLLLEDQILETVKGYYSLRL